MAAPTTITISYGTSSTQQLTIPSGIDYNQFVRDIIATGGAWFSDANNLLTFIPLGQITKITAS